MRILLIGSQNQWRMEAAVERALRRAGHETLLIDDRRTKRLIGRRLTQHWELRHARKFSPDFVFLSKRLALDTDTVGEIIRNRQNGRDWDSRSTRECSRSSPFSTGARSITSQ